MENMLTVTDVSRRLGLSTRMLRYYEEQGLIESGRLEGYAYRVYDEEAVRRLRQVIVLRRLRIPLREVKLILDDPGAQWAIYVFQQKLSELDREMEDIGALRDIIGELLESLKGRYWLPAGDVLLDEDICSVLPALANSYELEKERAGKMENLTKAEENMQLKDVRIVHIPAAAVASARYFGPDPENHAGRMIADFTRENKLWEKVPDLRMFGFNSPNPPPEGGEYGYEFWVTIPDDMDVPAPLEKKRLPGGTYAAHAIRMGDFHEWQWLFKWAYESGEYEIAGSGTPEDMYGCLEEHLNFYEHIQETPEGEPEIPQLDLLIPVRKKG